MGPVASQMAGRFYKIHHRSKQVWMYLAVIFCLLLAVSADEASGRLYYFLVAAVFVVLGCVPDWFPFMQVVGEKITVISRFLISINRSDIASISHIQAMEDGSFEKVTFHLKRPGWGVLFVPFPIPLKSRQIVVELATADALQFLHTYGSEASSKEE